MALSNDNPAGTRFFSNLRFRYKILALPLVATLGFLVILAANGIMASRQEQRLLLVESVYYPSVQLSAGLETTMIENMTIIERLAALHREAEAEMAAIADEAALEQWRIRYLGRKGGALNTLWDTLPTEERPAAGREYNRV